MSAHDRSESILIAQSNKQLQELPVGAFSPRSIRDGVEYLHNRKVHRVLFDPRESSPNYFPQYVSLIHAKRQVQ